MRNETKLILFVFLILLTSVAFGWAFGLSVNPQTLQVGYTVYTENGDRLKGFIPEAKISSHEAAQCPHTCPETSDKFSKQCREKGHKVYNGPCCKTLCSGNVASNIKDMEL